MTGPILCFGELLLRLTTGGPDGLAEGRSLKLHVGGAEANVAGALARFGHEVRMISALPQNALGAAVRGELRRRDIDDSAVETADGRLGLYFHLGGSGHRPAEIVYDRVGSVFAETPASRYDWTSLLDGASWLHLSGVTPAIGPGPAEAAAQAAEAAAARGLEVSFDFNHREKMWARWGGDPAPYLRRLAGAATVLFANDHDLDRVLSDDGAERGRGLTRAAAAFEAFPRLRMIATAARTARSVEDQSLAATVIDRSRGIGTAEAHMSSVVDRIGAGDAFAAGLIHADVTGEGVERIAATATASSCLKHAVPGDMSDIGPEQLAHYLSGSGADVLR